MSEAPVGIEKNVNGEIRSNSSVSKIKEEILNPHSISKKQDQEGRDRLASEIREIREIKQEIENNEAKIDQRQQNTLVKLKNILHVPDKKTAELQKQLKERKSKEEQYSDPREMVKNYYEKIASTPLTNKEKRELLKPEVLAQLTTEEYIVLWKRLNPYFLSHITRQGFRDHWGLENHLAGMGEFHNGFLNVIGDEKKMKPQLYLSGLKNRDEASVREFLTDIISHSLNEEEAKKEYYNFLLYSVGDNNIYPDRTSIHFAAQMVSGKYYGGELGNEIFFVFPSDVLASQLEFGFSSEQKDFTHLQNESKHNNVYIWPNSLENPEILIDTGMVFIPENTPVDSETGSRYLSEIKIVDGKEKRVRVEDLELREKYLEFIKGLNEKSPIINGLKLGKSREISYAKYQQICYEELSKVGFYLDPSDTFLSSFMEELNHWDEDFCVKAQKLYDHHNSLRFKMSVDTISSKNYWEKYFNKHPEKRPKHVVYYNGDPTEAVHEFLQRNGIGGADTSAIDGQLLGFDDHHVKDIMDDPRSNRGKRELVDLGNKIIEEHYQKQ